MTIRTIAALMLTLVMTASAQAAGPAATIDQLDWMTGNWAGNVGSGQLEENWIAAESGSIAAMVRMTGAGETNMFEMITIEEADGSLVLNIQQWDPGFEPRTEGPQTMELSEITDNSVMFEAVSDGGMASLGYSHPDAETFIIHVGRPDGSTMDIELMRRSLWE
ncbi:MAG: DUF6265 family protein [Pseudomonadota bacterium]